MKRKLLSLLAVNMIVTSTAFAAVSDEEFEELRRQLAAVSQRLDALAAENAELKRSQAETATTVAEVKKSAAPAAKASWADRIKLDGDFRYRYEHIDPEGSSSRNRNRIRARANIKADVADDIQVGFGLATGGDDPVSTNQTLGGGGSSKSVVLNLAYVDWNVAEGWHLIGGKFKNPMTRVGKQPMLFDGDWTPEGLAVTYKRDWFFANAIGNYLESDSRRGSSEFSWGAQLGASGALGDVKLKGGIGYYAFGTAGKSPSFGDPSDPDDFFGNTAVEPGGLPCGTNPGTDCVLLYDYNLTQVFAEAAFDVGDWPMVAFLDYVDNSDPSDNNTAWTLGAKVGQTKDRGDMQFTYYYADKEADSMLGLLTDSDFGGGGTDSEGHWLQFNYGVSKNWTIGAQYFINETSIASGSESDYNRLMIDMQWKWK